MAGTAVSSPGGKKKARIEIIPLIDVIFFLLATFVLFTLSLNKSGGVSGIILPQSDSGEQRPEAQVTISVTEAGTIAWNKDFISLAEFIDRLRAFKSAEPDGKILINGDENALFNSALYVFDEARKAGFQKIFIETKVRGSGGKS
jgi:biopolymer transport protein ExbD